MDCVVFWIMIDLWWNCYELLIHLLDNLYCMIYFGGFPAGEAAKIGRILNKLNKFITATSGPRDHPNVGQLVAT
jgi:hypothetical protein